ncbi:heat-inducible transcriptional repressor HrcA [Echinimonas agarilytica]|uniref:Heat-inducible transcription repressor HrcA n=1 Tax=Echinimonas agarilytica TaxID=1215918 RepID=A0AA41W6L8_9GAMM|nr:heat-inducible transcriptional repressor HrcA [Echinimonas agarilytica]MCM2679652.1 heat-inducible transcriptional repressor HrcA [Echinimonas agarilytica]
MKKLNARAEQVLQHLIEEFIRSGNPVGSKSLADHQTIQASPATVRNVMSQLERSGLLMSPHTSAGRIPTEYGLRLFVDSMLTAKPCDDWHKPMQNQLDLSMPTQQLCRSASDLLSEMTQLTGFVMLPHCRSSKLARIELVQLTETRVLAVLVSDDGSVHNRMLQMNRHFSADCLLDMTQQLNKLLQTHDIEEIQQHLSQWVDAEEAALEVGQQALDLAEQTSHSKQYHVAGEAHLLDADIANDVSQIRSVFDGVLQAEKLLELVDSCLDSEGVKLYIGKESGIDFLSSCSVVSSPYAVNGKVVGALAVIGPMRMDYSRVIPMVDVTAKMLSSALSSVQR